MGNHFGGQAADFLADELELDDGVGSVAEIDNGTAQGLVQGSEAAAETLDTLDGAQGLFEGSSQGNSAVFGGVMVID